MITAATATAAPPESAPPRPLESLHDLPGLAHALLVDADGGVLDEVGTDEGTADAVVAWGRRVADVGAGRDLALDDLIVTTEVAHHLLRAVGGSSTRGPRGRWVYLRVRRDGGNLALARRRLAGLTTPSAPAASRPPTGTAGPAELPAGPSAPARPSTAGAAPAALPASPIRSGPVTPPQQPAPPIPEGRRAGPSTLPSPRRPPAATALPAAPVPPPREEAGPSPPRDSAGVLGQRWRTDPETLRRVLAGLLRLGRSPQAALAGSPDTTTTRSPGATPTRRNP